jgi:subtilisin family serine protease
MNKWKLSFIKFLFFSTVLISAILPAHSQATFVSDEVVVKLKRAQDLRLVAKRFGLSPQPIERFGNRPIYRMKIVNGASPTDTAAAMLADVRGRVQFAEPNFILGFPEQNGNSWTIGGSTNQYATQWFRETVRLAPAHLITRGAGTKIAILDTGFALNHPELAGRFIGGYDFVDDDAVPAEVGSQPQNPGFGHGTHVAGLVALVAPEAQILPVRVLDPDGVGNIWVLAEAIAYAADPDGNPETNDGADVINLSLATSRQTTLLAEIIDEITCDVGDDLNKENIGGDQCAILKDTIVIAGAGNNASDVRQYPAGENVAGLLAVGASDQNDLLASFSNFGSWVRVAAPGQNILSTVPPNLFAVWSGTSMSTPIVAGQAALLRAQNPNLRAFEVVEQIVNTADPINALVPRRVDVGASLGSS